MELISNYLDLNENDFLTLNDSLKTKLIQNSNQFYQKYEQLENNYEKFKIEYEQRFIDLETEYNQLKTNFETETHDCQMFKIKFNEIDDKYRNTAKSIKILEDEKETLQSSLQRLTTVNQNLEAEKRDLIRFLDKRNQDMDKLNEDWKLLNRKLTENEAKICEYTMRVEEFQNRESSIVLKEKQFQIDRERLLNEIDWLNKQLSLKSTQILDVKAGLSQQVYDLESKLDAITNENRKNKSLLESTQAANVSLEEQVNELTQKLQESRENIIKLKNDFDSESSSREKLITLYKTEIEDYKTKLNDASQTLIELKNMLNEATQEYSKLADERHEYETVAKAKIKERDDAILKLEQELKNANELLSIAKRKGATVLSESDIEELSPAAAVASRLLKSGMTLTQIYSEYVNLTEQLQNEKNENERLKSYISEIINDVQEKAPILKRQKHEYEEALHTINKLTNQLEKSMMDYEVLKSRSEDSIKKYNLIYSENIRLKQDVNDLSRQVTTLLYEVEKLRAKLLSAGDKQPIKRRDDEMIDSSSTTFLGLSNMFNEANETEVTSSSDVITKHMIDFRNIEELQQQNQKLIHYARGITEQKELEEKAEYEQRTKEYTEKLDLAFKKLEEFRVQREKQENLVEEICKQRDTYKELLEQLQDQQQHQSQLNTSVSSMLFGGRRGGEGDSGATQAAIEKLQEQFNKYQREMSENSRLLNEDLDRYRQLNSELNTKLALSESRLESVTEKCKTLNTTIEKYKKECDILKERSSKLNELIVKHEQIISQNNMELNVNKEKLSELEINLRNASMERDMYKGNYDRLSRDHELLVKENQSRSQILSNIETIKNSCERSEREARHIYTEKIEQLEKENKILTKKCETSEEQFKLIQKSFETQLSELEKRLQNELHLHQQTKAQLTANESELSQLKEKLQEYEAKLHSNEQLLQMTRNSKSSTTITRLTELEESCKELQSKLSLSEKEIVSLKIQLEDSKLHIKQYTTIAENTEKALHEANDTNEKLKRFYDEKCKQIETEKSHLEGELRQLHELNDHTNKEFNQFKVDSGEKIDQLNVQLADLSVEHNLVKETLNKTELLLAERTNDRDSYVAQLRIQEESLKTFEEQNQRLQAELNDLNEKLTRVQDECESLKKDNELKTKVCDDVQAQVIQIEEKYKEKCVSLERDNDDKLKQIDLLQDELAKLSEQIQILQKDSFNQTVSLGDLFKEAPCSDETTQDEEHRRRESTTHLYEINRFIRTQKEQIEEKYSSLQIQSEINGQRLKNAEMEVDFQRQKIQQYEVEIEHLKRLQAQFDSNKMSSITNEDFSLILDSNKRLKEQCDAYAAENGEMSERLRLFDEQLSQLKADKCAVELEKEAVAGENTCLQVENKRWKDRLENVIRSSNIGDEWQKTQDELVDAQRKAEELTTMINDLRRELNEQAHKYDVQSKELEQIKVERVQVTTASDQLTAANIKLTGEFETYKQERLKKDELFKTLINEMREFVTTLQSEFEVRHIDLTAAFREGPVAERAKNVRDVLQRIKAAILEKVNSFRMEIRTKTSELTDCRVELERQQVSMNELDLSSKAQIDESSNRINELQQRNKLLEEKAKNAINTAKSALERKNKQIEDLKKSYMSGGGGAGGAGGAADTQASSDGQETFQTNVTDALTVTSQTPSTVTPVAASTSAQPPVSSVKSTPTSTLSDSSTQSQQQQQQQQLQQQQRTAYIAPSRITKITPLNQPFSGLSRRTAAVHPTPQQLVTPLAATEASSSSWQARQQQQQSQIQQQQATTTTATPQTVTVVASVVSTVVSDTEAVIEEAIRGQEQQQQQQPVQPSTSQGTTTTTSTTQSGSNSQAASKRTREENDEALEDSANDTNGNNKKLRQATSIDEPQTFDQQDQISANVATIEPYGTEQQQQQQAYVETNEYIIVQDEGQTDDGEQDVEPEEIVIEESGSEQDVVEEVDDDSSDNDDVIITEPNAEFYETSEDRENNEMNQNQEDEDEQLNSNETQTSDDLNMIGQQQQQDEDEDEDDDDGDHQQLESDNLTTEDDGGDNGEQQQEGDEGDEQDILQDDTIEEQENVQSQEEGSTASRDNQQSGNFFASLISTTAQVKPSTSGGGGTASTIGQLTQSATSSSASNEKREPIKPIVWDVDTTATNTNVNLNSQQISGPTGQQFASGSVQQQQTQQQQQQQQQQQSSFRLRRMQPTPQQQQIQAQLQHQQQMLQQQQQQRFSSSSFLMQQQQQQPSPQQLQQQQQQDNFSNLLNMQTQQRVMQQRFIQTRGPVPIIQTSPGQLMQQQQPPQQMQQQQQQRMMGNQRGGMAQRGGGMHRGGGRGGNASGRNPY